MVYHVQIEAYLTISLTVYRFHPAYTVKKVIVFPVPSRDVTNQTLTCREKFNNSLPGRVWLVTSRLGTGKTITFFYSVRPLLRFQLSLFSQ
jgi:hypothetical protein